MKKVIVRDISRAALERNDGKPVVLGQMVDNGRDEPFGTTEAIDESLASDRRGRFDRYFAGYSNGYVEWINAEKVSSGQA